MSFRIIADSCCDRTKETEAMNNITFIPLTLSIGEYSISDDENFNQDDFISRVDEAGIIPKTACPAPDAFKKAMECDEDDVYVITITDKLSGTYNSARIAAEDLSVKYPDRKIFVVDSLGASSGYGLLMDMAADLRDSGMSIEEVRNWIIENRLKVNHWFFSTDLTFYIKGGRVSRTAGVFGTILKICPLLNMNIEGKLIPRKKIRGKAAVIKAIVDSMEATAENGLDYSGKCFISNSACREDAEKVAEMIKERFPNIDGDIKIFNIGSLIGSHSGPGTVAVFFFGKDRTI